MHDVPLTLRDQIGEIVIAVALGAWCALAAVAALAVTAGSWIVRRVPLRTVQRVAGVVFLGFGVAAAVSVVV